MHIWYNSTICVLITIPSLSTLYYIYILYFSSLPIYGKQSYIIKKSRLSFTTLYNTTEVSCNSNLFFNAMQQCCNIMFSKFIYLFYLARLKIKFRFWSFTENYLYKQKMWYFRKKEIRSDNNNFIYIFKFKFTRLLKVERSKDYET